jgi:hypothetical protein
MKIVITMQSPTAIRRAIYEAAAASAQPGESSEELYERREEMCKILDKYVENRERVNIEFDLKTGTARLIPLKEDEEPQEANAEGPASGPDVEE